MVNPFEDETSYYLVLVNDEGEYSLWPAWREVPSGWETVGPRGKRQECLNYIELNWTDMRPRSLIRQLETAAAPQHASAQIADQPAAADPDQATSTT